MELKVHVQLEKRRVESAALDGYYAASKNKKFEFGEGIIGRNVESTTKNVGTLGQVGMNN